MFFQKRMLDPPGTGVADGCKPLCGWYGPNTDSQGEKEALLATSHFSSPLYPLMHDTPPVFYLVFIEHMLHVGGEG